MELRRQRIPCQPGLQFGSRLFGNVRIANNLGCLPYGDLYTTEQLGSFAGMLIFDKWTSNADGRQVIFSRAGGQLGYSMAMIDQGFCFNCGEWNFPDSPLRGLYLDRRVYAEIKTLDDFEPWLSKLESELTLGVLFDLAKDIPPEWYAHQTDSLHSLLSRLNRRRGTVREQLQTACRLSPRVFPKWIKGRELQGNSWFAVA